MEKPEPLKGVLKRGDFATWEEFYDMAQDYMQNVFPGTCQPMWPKTTMRAP